METNQNKTSILAIVGMVLGIMSLLAAVVLGGFYFGIPGLIVSIVAMVNIKNKKLSGKGLAIAGIITSVLALIASVIIIVVAVFVVDTAADAVGDTTNQYSDIYTGQTMETAVYMAYTNVDVYNDMQKYNGMKITFTKDVYATLPESFRTAFETSMGTSEIPVPAYTDNGAKYFAVEFEEDGFSTIYATDGVEFWEVYPNPCDEYQ